jgi:hypothetical protein
MPFVRLTWLHVFLAIICTWQACAAQEFDARLDPKFQVLLPEYDAELIGGTMTKVSFRLAIQASVSEPIEYAAHLTMNGKEYAPFLITMGLDTSGTAIASWYVCTPFPTVELRIKLVGRGVDSGKRYEFGQELMTFHVKKAIVQRCCFVVKRTRCRFEHHCYRHSTYKKLIR